MPDDKVHLPIIEPVREMQLDLESISDPEVFEQVPEPLKSNIKKLIEDQYKLLCEQDDVTSARSLHLSRIRSVVNAQSIQDEHTRSVIDSLTQLGEGMPACKERCPHCCNIFVSVSDSELRTIAQYVAEHFSEVERAELQARVLDLCHKMDERVGSIPNTVNAYFAEAYTRLRDDKARKARLDMDKPCPFLVDQKCSIYEVRPFLCRGYTSQDVELCKHPTGPARINVDLYLWGYGMQMAFLKFESERLTRSPLELTEGMRFAFTQPPLSAKNPAEGLLEFSDRPSTPSGYALKEAHGNLSQPMIDALVGAVANRVRENGHGEVGAVFWQPSEKKFPNVEADEYALQVGPVASMLIRIAELTRENPNFVLYCLRALTQLLPKDMPHAHSSKYDPIMTPSTPIPTYVAVSQNQEIILMGLNVLVPTVSLLQGLTVPKVSVS